MCFFREIHSFIPVKHFFEVKKFQKKSVVIVAIITSFNDALWMPIIFLSLLMLSLIFWVLFSQDGQFLYHMYNLSLKFAIPISILHISQQYQMWTLILMYKFANIIPSVGSKLVGIVFSSTLDVLIA